MTVRAKFKVNSIERTMGGTTVYEDGISRFEKCEMWTIKMQPVYGNGDPEHENTKFWQASPGGLISLNCVNAAAVSQFELEKEYYVDFTLAS